MAAFVTLTTASCVKDADGKPIRVAVGAIETIEEGGKRGSKLGLASGNTVFVAELPADVERLCRRAAWVGMERPGDVAPLPAPGVVG